MGHGRGLRASIGPPTAELRHPPGALAPASKRQRDAQYSVLGEAQTRLRNTSQPRLQQHGQGSTPTSTWVRESLRCASSVRLYKLSPSPGPRTWPLEAGHLRTCRRARPQCPSRSTATAGRDLPPAHTYTPKHTHVHVQPHIHSSQSGSQHVPARPAHAWPRPWRRTWQDRQTAQGVVHGSAEHTAGHKLEGLGRGWGQPKPGTLGAHAYTVPVSHTHMHHHARTHGSTAHFKL